MTSTRDVGTVVATVLAACVLAFAAVVLGHVPPLVVLGVGVGVVLAVTAVALRGVEDAGVVLLVLGVATSPWNAVVLPGGLKLSHALLALATLLVAIVAVGDRVTLRVPPWVWVLGGTVAVSAVLSLVVPPSPGWFAARTIDDTHVTEVPALYGLGLAGLVEGAQWLVPLVALPVALCLVCPRRPWLTMSLADAWVGGTAVSALVALTDKATLTGISAGLLPYVDVGGRQAGLSVQPNHVAVSIAIAVPLAVWRLAHGGAAARTFAASSLALMAGGLVVSESRGAVVAALLGAAAVVVIDPRARRAVAPLALTAAAAVAVVLALLPGVLTSVGDRLRLTGADDAVGSDAIRATVAEQALRDFAYAPLHGIGLEVVVQGHVIYLQLLAAGGLLLLVGFALGVGGSLVSAWRRRAALDGLALALAVCTGTWLVAGFVENQLTDVFLYIPLALTAGLRAVRTAAPATASPPVLVGGTR